MAGTCSALLPLLRRTFTPRLGFVRLSFEKELPLGGFFISWPFSEIKPFEKLPLLDTTVPMVSWLSHRSQALNFKIRILIIFLFVQLSLHAQFRPADFVKLPVNFEQVNDGFQNINPNISADGQRLWFTKIAHPSNLGRKVGQDVWSTEIVDGKWIQPTNDLPGLNSERNDLIIGTGNSHLLYLIQFEEDKDDQLHTVRVFQELEQKYRLDHEFKIPALHFESEFFGFFVAADESYIIISMKGEYSFGKEDLYVMLKDGDEWGELIHLGARVNTIGFEMSPYMSRDGRHLFFASEGHGSYGSADIFVSVRLDDSWQNWSKPINLGPNINSDGFEAYFCLNEQRREAYFVSNRNGNTGTMYRIPYKPSSMDESFTAHPAASGFVRMEKLPSMSVKLNLLDENDQVIQSLTTNEEGYFNLQSFLPDRDYKIAIDESVRDELSGADIFLTNDLGEKMVFMNEKELGIFGFKVLSDQKVDEYDKFAELAQAGRVVDRPTTISGKVATYGTLKEQVELKIMDENNNVVENITTDENGYFSFSTNASEKSYFLSVDESITGLVDVYEIFLTNNNPNEDIVVTKTDKHLFEFRALADGSNAGMQLMAERDSRIPQSILEKYSRQPTQADEGITGFLKLGKLPMINTEIMLMDENDKMLGKAVTDEMGRFVFSDKLDEGDYTLKLESDQEGDLEKSEIFLAKNPSEVLFYLNDGRAGVFAFKKLAREKAMTLYSLREQTESGTVVREEETSLKGKFHYETLPKSGVQLKLMDESENVLQVTDVDENGEFEFENFTVNENYFIAVEDGSGLSDIYQIYLSGQKKNVLVNNTNRFVFSFQVLPTQDILITEAYERDTELNGTKTLGPRTGSATFDEDNHSYYEFDLTALENSNYAPLKRILVDIENEYRVTLRLSREEKQSSSEVELKTLKISDADQVVTELMRMGVSRSRIKVRPNARDQLLLIIRP